MASAIVGSVYPQQHPPIYILQSWRREQSTPYDEYLIEQPFLTGPDAAVPSSRLRQCIKNVYEQRQQALIVVHYDPWEKRPTSRSNGTSTRDLPSRQTY
ncbi:hypothetical protein I4U23_013601 [Adineta vaga]|nr:hypothetical protein I4U23_013601 [Adineta vaga]